MQEKALTDKAWSLIFGLFQYHSLLWVTSVLCDICLVVKNYE